MHLQTPQTVTLLFRIKILPIKSIELALESVSLRFSTTLFGMQFKTQTLQTVT